MLYFKALLRIHSRCYLVKKQNMFFAFQQGPLFNICPNFLFIVTLLRIQMKIVIYKYSDLQLLHTVNR